MLMYSSKMFDVVDPFSLFWMCSMFYFADDTLFFTHSLIMHQITFDYATFSFIRHCKIKGSFTFERILVHVSVTTRRANLNSAVKSCQYDAVQKQDAIQHVADLWLCKSRWGNTGEYFVRSKTIRTTHLHMFITLSQLSNHFKGWHKTNSWYWSNITIICHGALPPH